MALAFIRANPGCTFRSLVAGTGIACGTLRHHVTVLIRRRLVVEIRYRHALYHYAADCSIPDGPAAAAWRSPGVRELASWLASHPVHCQRDVLAAFPQWADSTVQHRLNRLVHAGLVREDRSHPRRVAYQWVGHAGVMV